MTDQQAEAQERVAAIRKRLRWFAGRTTMAGNEMAAYVRELCDVVDALSARLDQECALRAQAEQERGEAWDKADFEAEAAEKAEASLRDVETRLRAMELSRDEANHRYDVERRRGDAIRGRLREYEDALLDHKAALAEIEAKPYRAEEVIARFRAGKSDG